MSTSNPKPGMPGWLRLTLVGVTFAICVTILMLWLAGRFSPKVPTNLAGEAATTRVSPDHVVEVRALTIPVTETAVGTIRAVHETTVASKLIARVVEVKLKAGQAVKRGEVLVRLDDADLAARLQQAQAQVASAQAQRERAAVEEQRLARAVEQRAASAQEYELAKASLAVADAELARARQLVKETQANLDYATIVSPMDAIVVDKNVDVGDTVTPGATLLTLYDPRQMQLVASVRESLAHRLAVGQNIAVRIEGLDKTCTGQISEVVPEAQSASRTFQVKVTASFPANVYSGMFGRMVIPLDDEQVLVVPQSAVRRVGQLELVDVVESGTPHRRAIRTGRQIGDELEVLSGLRAGERVVADVSSTQEGA